MSLVDLSFFSDEVALLKLNSPENLNAMSDEMSEDFCSVISNIKNNNDLRVLILTGEGKAFSSGGNLKMLEQKITNSSEENRVKMLKFYNNFLSIQALDIPTICAINGVAYGAGLCLACACDIRIAVESAKLGFNFVKLGLYPGMGATYLIKQILNPALANELLISGRILSSDEAIKIGLISKVTSSEDLFSYSIDLAKQICLSSKETLKQLVFSLKHQSYSLKESLEKESLYQSLSYSSDDFKSRLNKLLEKKK